MQKFRAKIRLCNKSNLRFIQYFCFRAIFAVNVKFVYETIT